MKTSSPVRLSFSAHKKMIFPLLFPRAPQAAAQRAISGLILQDIFQKGFSSMPVYQAFLREDRGMVISDPLRMEQLAEGDKSAFQPVEVMESRSERACIWVSPEGEVVEFKGLTPSAYDCSRINVNSGDPEGLFTNGGAAAEVLGLSLVGEVASGRQPLGEYFPDLADFSQIYRSAKKQPYLAWLRLDLRPELYETLAALEEKPLERFLFESGERAGRQIGKMHAAGMTLHNPFREGTLPKDPFYSSLHSGNVEVHGNLIDLEGMLPFPQAEARFQGLATETGFEPERLEPLLAKNTFASISRAVDLARFIGGRPQAIPRESTFFTTFANRGKAPVFVEALRGTLIGYYQISDPLHTAGLREGLDQYQTALLSGRAGFSLEQMLNIMSWAEKELELNPAG